MEDAVPLANETPLTPTDDSRSPTPIYDSSWFTAVPSPTPTDNRSWFTATTVASSSSVPVIGAGDQIDVLTTVLPGVPKNSLKFLLDISSGDANQVSNLFLEDGGGLSLSCLVEFMRSSLLLDGVVRRLILDEYDDQQPDSLTQEAIAFYKGSRFDQRCEIRIRINDQPVVDTGGARRQFFNDVFANIATSQQLRLFEGTANRLRPVFRQSSISSGMMSLVGKMVGHSILMDCQGFPFLSPSCYYYMAGYTDQAMAECSLVDAGDRVSQVVSKVSLI